VQAVGRQPQRAPDCAPIDHERHRQEQTTLYRLVLQHAASFIAHTEASTGCELPGFIKDKFENSSNAASWPKGSRVCGAPNAAMTQRALQPAHLPTCLKPAQCIARGG
jgi:hypothetical protein